MFALGGNGGSTKFDPVDNKVEVYNVSRSSWMPGPEYPYSSHITNYAIQPFANEFIIFGGMDILSCSAGSPDSGRAFTVNCIISTIASYNPFEKTWSYLGQMKTPRYGHSVVLLNNQFMVFGGVYEQTYKPKIETYIFDENYSKNRRAKRSRMLFTAYDYDQKLNFSAETLISGKLGEDLAVMIVPPLYADKCNTL